MDAESILKGLNADQRAAVLHDHRKGAQLLILAGAGSGKTSVLTKRIQYRIASGTAPEKILALTFTAKAASEMRERVQKLFPDAGVRLCTFHSLALFILRQKIGGRYAYEMVGFEKPPVPSESAGRDYLEALARSGLAPGVVDREMLFADTHPRRILAKLDGIRREVLKSGSVVFEDLIYQTINLLETHADARNHFMEMWSEIMVDEYQDINPSQYRLVRALLGDRRELFVVGDDDQAIYGFRGADIGNIERFCRDFSESTLIRLEWNYRSTPSILHLANEIFVNKPLRLRKVLRAGNLKGSGGNPLFRENRLPEEWTSDNPVEEIQKISQTVRDLRMSYDLLWKNFAVLVRYNRQRLYYEEALREAGIPVATEDEDDGAVEDGIHVETVHASKGLQYAVVFYAGLAEGLTPGECTGTRRERRKQSDEERRLYYVGVTRAEAYLILLYCKKRFWKGRLRNLKRSRFLPGNVEPSKNLKMPVLLFRIYVAATVLAYMLVHIVLLPLILLRYRGEFNTWFEKKIQLFSKFCMRRLRIDLSVEDQAMLGRVDWSRPVFVMANHNSYSDIPVIFLAVERTVGFIAKRELQRIPFLNFWMHRIGCIFVNRKKGGDAHLIREAMESGRVPVLSIFPEGTRGKDDGLSPFKSGGFRLSIESDATILPVAIKGTRYAWENRKNAGRVKVTARILEPLDIRELHKQKSELEPRKDVMWVIRGRMEDALR